MATNRERLERLGTSMQEIQTSIQQILERGQDQQNPWGRRHGSPQLSEGSSDGDSDGSQGSNKSNQSWTTERVEKENRQYHIKMDFPRFGGGEPRVWLNRAKQFFIANNIHGKKKITLASYYLEGDANRWWQWF